MIPKRVNVELNSQDLREDLEKIINTMTNIRDHKAPFAETKDEYLHNAYRLGSIISELNILPNKLNNAVNNIEDYLYDPRNGTDNKITDELDVLFFAYVGDKIKSIDQRYHVYQAIKVIKAEQSDPKKRKEIFDTVLPRQEIKNKKKSFLKKISHWFFDNSKEKIDGNRIEITCDEHQAENKIDDALERGFTDIHLDVPEKYYKENKDRFINAKLHAHLNYPHKYDKLIYNSAFVLFPLYGSLPANIRTWVDNNSDKLDMDIVSSIRNLLFGAAGFALGVYGGLIDDVFIAAAGAAMLTDGLGTAYLSVNAEKQITNPSMYLPTLPINLLFDYLNNKRNRYEADYRVKQINAEFDCESIINNAFEEAKKLEWTTENHFTFGDELIKKLDVKDNYSVKKHQEAEMISITSDTKIGRYTKNTGVYIQKDGMYVITTIGKVDQKSMIVQTFTNEMSDKERVTYLGSLGSRYIHIKKYVDGDLVEDLEGSQ